MAELWAKGRTESDLCVSWMSICKAIPATKAHGFQETLNYTGLGVWILHLYMVCVNKCLVSVHLCNHVALQHHGTDIVSHEDDDLDNAYELLGLEDDAGEKEIKADGTSASEG